MHIDSAEISGEKLYVEFRFNCAVTVAKWSNTEREMPDESEIRYETGSSVCIAVG